MLNTVDVCRKLAGQVASALVKLSVDVGPLGALKAIQQDTSYALVEVFLDASDHFLEDIGLGTSLSAFSTLGCRVVCKELCYRSL